MRADSMRAWGSGASGVILRQSLRVLSSTSVLLLLLHQASGNDSKEDQAGTGASRVGLLADLKKQQKGAKSTLTDIEARQELAKSDGNGKKSAKNETADGVEGNGHKDHVDAAKVRAGVEVISAAERESTILRCDGPAYDRRAMNPPNVSVGLYLLNIASENGLTSGQFFAEFLLFLRRGNRGISRLQGKDIIEQLTFSNAKAIDSTTKHGDGVYRVSGTFFFSPDLRLYPFDQQTLSVVMEQIEAPISDCVFVPEPDLNGLSPSIRFPGWASSLIVLDPHNRQYKGNCAVKSSTKVYPGATVNYVGSADNVTFSRFTYTLTVDRPVLQGFLTDLFPPLVVLMPITYSYALDPLRDTTSKMSLCSGALVAVILIYRGVAADLPPLNYLTFYDKFMACVYVHISVALLHTVATYISFDNEDAVLTRPVKSELKWVAFWIAILSAGVLFLIVLPAWIFLDTWIVIPCILLLVLSLCCWTYQRWNYIKGLYPQQLQEQAALVQKDLSSGQD